MRAKTFLEIHEALLSWSPLLQCNWKGDVPGLHNGLCCVWLNDSVLEHNNIFKLMMPDDPMGYWADDTESWQSDFGTKYHDLRQNIILFCAAMNGEL